jgi:hypothetical protein
MPCSTVHDGFATIRRPRVGPPRAPPRPPSLASVPEDPRIGCPTSPFGRPTVPWWELATRRSRYRSCPTLELHVSIAVVGRLISPRADRSIDQFFDRRFWYTSDNDFFFVAKPSNVVSQGRFRRWSRHQMGDNTHLLP